MNKLTTSLLVSLVVVIVVFFLGRLVLLSGIQREIMQSQNRLDQLEDNKQTLETELSKLRNKVKEEIAPQRSSTLLKAGSEHILLSSIIAHAGNMKINQFELMPSYFVKNPEDEFGSSSNSAQFGAGDELPQLDDQGMPVGASVEDDTEWAGVEIVPVRFSFTTTFRNLGQFFSQIDKLMPINQIRSADILLQDSMITRGTVVMLFPVAEK